MKEEEQKAHEREQKKRERGTRRTTPLDICPVGSAFVRSTTQFQVISAEPTQHMTEEERQARRDTERRKREMFKRREKELFGQEKRSTEAPPLPC